MFIFLKIRQGDAKKIYKKILSEPEIRVPAFGWWLRVNTSQRLVNKARRRLASGCPLAGDSTSCGYHLSQYPSGSPPCISQNRPQQVH